MKTVLVTGAGGYIGSVLTPKLLQKGYHIKAIDRFFFGLEKLSSHVNLEIIRDDSRRLTDDHFKDVDYVIDLVALSNDPASEMFSDATWEINYQSRVNNAKRAKKMGVKRYILPSSCSIYGFTEDIVDETSRTNPLSTYSKANKKAEQGVLPLADDNFAVIVMRQATVFGFSPRMRFDLAINGMTYGAWKTHKLPLMRDGSQYRPMVHVQDTTDVMLLLLEHDSDMISGQIFNVGSEQCNYQIRSLAGIVSDVVSRMTNSKVDIEWYGDPDHRSYRVNFSKIEKTLNWQAKYSGENGVVEIVEALKNGQTDKTSKTITLQWYNELVKWHKIIKSVEKYGGIFDIE
ncbi:MAG: SDR family oxidoreductase [candidate division Zixibacteria bacterium]|nr:SDR family oxidoreductase [candidate division Zixibacteria bacterium]